VDKGLHARSEARSRTSIDAALATFQHVTLLALLSRAFDLKSRSQVKGPEWIFSARYDITARLPENATKAEVPEMLRNLLIERFRLKYHQETRDLPGYALLAGNGHLKLKPSNDPNGERDSFVMNEGRREARNMNMGSLARTFH
jgi:uncharacterized protein (TIGR03435 family)